MTCKISYIKTIRETLKHHIASIFTVCLVFFIQLIVFFLNVQTYASRIQDENITPNAIKEWLTELTQPSFGYALPIIFVGTLLAFDFFRYLHSKKQIDFYDSLPIQRKDWFILRFLSAGLVFLIPYCICVFLEAIILVSFDLFSTVLLCNLFWNAACMLLSFLIVFIFGALCMILTGNSIVALFIFGIISLYAPILIRYLYPIYAEQYFQTYFSDTTKLYYLNYLSPMGLAYKLTHSYFGWTLKDHGIDFIAIIVMIALSLVITYCLFKKRPSESAEHAMSFEKWNSVIRILIVIPVSLYIGMYLSMIAVTGSYIWMIFGFAITCILLNGIIESIFRFDIRGLWSHKRQMLTCFVVSFVIALTFWLDLFHYDQYLPALDKVETVTFTCNGVETNTEEQNGLYGANIGLALQLAENIIEQGTKLGDGPEREWIMFEYHLKNGAVKTRQYYMDYESNKDLLDQIFATKDYKDDICRLYNDDWSQISHISLGDGISDIPLFLTNAEMEMFFNTYMTEYTPLTFSYQRENSSIINFTTHSKNEDEFYNYTCYVYPNFTQTIALLEQYIAADENAKEFGSITDSPLDRYPIQSLEIYCDEMPVNISDIEIINSLKKDMIYMNDYLIKFGNVDCKYYYDANVTVKTSKGFDCITVCIPKNVVDKITK